MQRRLLDQLCNWKMFVGKHNSTGTCDKSIYDCAQATEAHKMQQNCESENAVDAPIGNPFSCMVSSGLEGIVGYGHVLASFAKQVVLKPAILADTNELLVTLNDHFGGISYRNDLSCEFRSLTEKKL